MTEYHINLFWSEEDACWIGDIPDLKYCSAHGETPDAALREVIAAKKAWLASAKAPSGKFPSRAIGRPFTPSRFFSASETTHGQRI